MHATATHRLADVLLGDEGPLDQFVARRRPGRSWRLIARDLYESTHGEVDVTYETLRQWFAGVDELVDAPDLEPAGSESRGSTS